MIREEAGVVVVYCANRVKGVGVIKGGCEGVINDGVSVAASTTGVIGGVSRVKGKVEVRGT